MKNKIFAPEKKEIAEVVSEPYASIIMPFEPMMSSKSGLENKLKDAVEKCELELLGRYPKDVAEPVLIRLKRVVADLNYMTHKKSIGIFVSGNFEKVYYLETSVYERSRINESFEIRNLVKSRMDLRKYLLLVIDDQCSKIYLGANGNFSCIVSNDRHNMVGHMNETKLEVSNSIDSSNDNLALNDNFMKLIDDGLSILVNTEHLPVFIMGSQKSIKSFKRITRNDMNVLDFIYGDFGKASQEEIRKALEPYIRNWKKVNEKDLMHRLDHAIKKGKFSVGILDVRKAASQNKGKLLIVEKNYLITFYERTGDPFSETNFSTPQTFNFNNVVDEVIEKVLKSGGDVQFVEEGVLPGNERIALIHF